MLHFDVYSNILRHVAISCLEGKGVFAVVALSLILPGKHRTLLFFTTNLPQSSRPAKSAFPAELYPLRCDALQIETPEVTCQSEDEFKGRNEAISLPPTTDWCVSWFFHCLFPLYVLTSLL